MARSASVNALEHQDAPNGAVLAWDNGELVWQWEVEDWPTWVLTHRALCVPCGIPGGVNFYMLYDEAKRYIK
jgi:hypothetical protein